MFCGSVSVLSQRQLK